MRLPRWLLVTLLTASVFAVVGLVLTAVWWWKTRPERLAREYLAAMTVQDFEELLRQSWPTHRFVPDPTLFNTMHDRLTLMKNVAPPWYDMSQTKAFVVRSVAYNLHVPARGYIQAGHLVINVKDGEVGPVGILWRDAKDPPQFAREKL